MALSELPVNHVSRNGLAMGRSKHLEGLLSRTGPKISSNTGGFSRDSSAIQGMLKNTTETGDVGPFSTRPGYLPQSIPRTIPSQNAAGRHDSGRRSSSRQRHEDVHNNLSNSQSGDLTSSSVVSVYVTQSQRSFRASSRGPVSEDDRSYSIAQSSRTNRSVPSPRLHSSHRFQGQGDLQGARPRSPYAYPTRLKRPGYRPSSPAYSDLNRPFPSLQGGYYPEASFRTQSPMSIAALKREPSGFQQGFGQPDSTFRYRSPSPGAKPQRAGPLSSSSTRVPTPGLPYGLAQIASESREVSSMKSAHTGWNSRRSASPIPTFYDYTEAFEEQESHFHMSMPPVIEQTTPQQEAIVYHELDGKTGLTGPFEIAGKERAAPSFQDIDEVDKRTRSLADFREAPLRTPRRSILENETSTTTSSIGGYERTVVVSQNQSELSRELSSPKSLQSDEATKSQSISTTNLYTNHPELATSDTQSLSADYAPQPVSSSGSMYSVQSSARPENTSHTPEKNEAAKPLAFQAQPRKSSSFTSEELDIEVEKTPPLQVALRDSSFDRWSNSEPSQIFAPTPERLISSPSHQHRFSRIFSIGEGSLGDGESEIALRRATDDLNTDPDEEETGVELGAGKITPASMRDRKSVEKLEGLFAGEKLVDLAPKDDFMRASGSKGNLRFPESPELRDDPSRSPKIETMESTFEVSTPLVALVPAAEEKLVVSSEDTAGVKQTTITSEPELNTSNVEPTLLPAKVDVSSLQRLQTFRSYSPPPSPVSSSLPYAFTPIFASKEDDAPRNVIEALGPEQKKESDKISNSSQPRLKLKKRAEKGSIESLPSSRPWNLDTSYPWTDEEPKLDVTMPDTTKELQVNDAKLPRFRLKIHRASSSTVGPVKLFKPAPPPLELSASRKTSLSSELFRSSTFTRRPRPSITITQNNSSHIGPIVTRFAENLTSPPRPSIASPCISLVPPSPGLNLEVRSFFSDDSSQVQPKGSLRKRISQLRAMATKGASSDDVRGAERGLLSSAMGKSRTSGRSMKQEAIPSEGLYNLKHIRWRLEERVKGWLHRSKDKVRSWGGKMRLPSPKIRAGPGDYSGL